MSALLAAVAAGSLVGRWAYVPALRNGRLPLAACETDHGVRYERDGRFTTFMADLSGRWRVERRWLIERITHEEDGETGKVRRLRERSTRTRLQWLSRDHVNLLIAPGAVQGLMRCRAMK